ncbi:hypothetical protein FRB90_012051 [Tulasnella sp. 427]|nr:hypothetical protein FRB90_012051 [Tulasnella sp. 427]
MSLTSVAGRGDGGIDLQGWWWLPQLTIPSALDDVDPKFTSASKSLRKTASSSSSLELERQKARVIAQCKAETKKLGPKHVRELEGVVSRLQLQSLLAASPGQVLSPTIAILISESMFTKASTLYAMSSPIPFLLLHLPPIAGAESGSGKSITKLKALESSELVGSALANPAFLGTSSGGDALGLSGRLEIRWERLAKPRADGERGRLGLWWDRKRLSHWIPPP